MVAVTKFSRQTVDNTLIPANTISSTSAPLPAVLSPVNFSGPNPDNDNLPYSLTFPFGPINLKYDQYAPQIVQIPRPQRKPLLFKENPRLRTVSFNALLADKNTGGTATLEGDKRYMDILKYITENALPCRFFYGTYSLDFFVVVTQLNFTESYRDEAGVPTRYNVTLQLTEHPMDVQELTELQAIAVEPETFTNIPPVPATPPAEDPPPDDPIPPVGTGYDGTIDIALDFNTNVDWDLSALRN